MAPAQTQSAIADENWKLLHYLNLYRLTVAVAASALAFAAHRVPPFGESDPGFFALLSLSYAALALVALETVRRRQPGFETQVTVLIFIDVVMITLLMHASGGITSGLGLLLLVSVAGASLMLGKRLTIFYAALAAVAVLIEHSWGLLSGGYVNLDGYPQVGMLGLGFFMTAVLGYTLAQRLRATEALAERRGVDLANLAQLNALIIDWMQSGVVVCDGKGEVRAMNKPARTFLGWHTNDAHPALAEVSADLAAQLVEWLQKPATRMRKLLHTRAGYSLLTRFIRIGSPRNFAALVFLEDTAIVRQQAQQLKMAALARLTAGIAHEVRNPLGAIANAVQLLAESAGASEESRRLIRIVQEQTRRMNAVVENVTQLSRRDRVSQVKLEIEPWLRDFAAAYCQHMELPAEAIAVVAAKGISVCVDPDQLLQVVTNLCQNALRHSPPFSGQPLIKLLTGRGDHAPFLDVIDWGSGVRPEVADKIFDPFFTTTPKGTGLGLYIARELCETNGGRLDYHPVEHGGARFRITFAPSEECVEFTL